MPVYIDRVFQRVNTGARLDSFGEDRRPLVVWWYSGIYKNTKEKSQPLVLVAFRQLKSKNQLSDELIFYRIPITLLGQVQIGSVWQNGRVLENTIFEIRNFDVEFVKGSWKFTSFHQEAKQKSTPPFPLELYPLNYEKDKNWLIQFDLNNDGKLIIPCLEFFTRCYGRSAELRRILSTYPWEGPEGCLDRFFLPIGEPERNGIWKIKLRKRLSNSDAVFLAHAKYDPYTKLSAKQIYSSLETSFDPNERFPSFIKIGPWFQGPAKLKVKGISFNDGSSFLGLRICGCSDPDGVPIDQNRENRGNAVNPAGPNAKEKAWAGAPDKQLNLPIEIMDLTAWDAPDQSQGSIGLEDPEFEILGTPRAVRTRRDKQAKDRGGVKGDTLDTTTLSSGDPHGDGKGIGKASIQAKAVLESQGVLRDMWNAMLYLQAKYPEVIERVEWFTQAQGFNSSKEPQLIALEGFSTTDRINGDIIPTDIRNWPYMDAKTQVEPRGILVSRLKIKSKYIHIIEIQRRACKRKNIDGHFSDAEQSFRGLVFKLENEKKHEEWITFVQSNVRYVKGIVHKLTKKCPGVAAAFNHNPSASNEVPYLSALRNALEKMDIYIE
ncbi:hypothetical protein MO867_11005 [Microbulbifer sp. OS29]|uniref:Uncharacterized protein n=1 Tax=Microbulbifer okhotskensis TaxID=2926617 RepID=A0A9X2ESC5_9GAMM|nr:hypothetical protein [Microbulbifer okhotskensis]MCO1334868.1 hypothetical protein [Microbulbifer okhotskensis]